MAEVKEESLTATHAFRRGTSLVVKATTDMGEREFHSLVVYMDLDSMWISPPKEEINLKGVGPGSELAITAEVALDRFESKVTLRGVTNHPEQMWRVDRPGEIRKGIGRAQLRAEVRLPGSILEVRRTDRPPPAEGEEEEPALQYPVNVVDISVGGVQFESLIEVLEGDNLAHGLHLPLPHLEEPFETEIQIMGSNTSKRASGVIRVYRCRFINTPPRHSNEISRYLYEVQLDTRVGSPRRRRVREEPYPFDQGLAVLEIGRKVTLECVGPSGNEEKWPTIIQDLDDEGILVMGPTYRGGAVAIDASKDIGVVIFNERTSALVVTRSRRISVVREPIFMWLLSPPTEFTRRHQRSHVRLPVNMDSTLHIFDGSQTPDVDHDFPVLVLDLSAGGAAFQTDERLPLGPDSTVDLTFELEGSRTPFHIRVEPVGEIEERRVVDRFLYRYKCQFMDLSIRREDEMTRYVFNQQAEARKRGMA